jgi:hypothetical protein
VIVRGDDRRQAMPDRADVARSIALGAAATAQALVPTFGPVLAGTRENAERYDTVITPPDYAFAIWGPIFAGCIANAVQHALPRHTAAPANRRSGWPLAGAYTLNAVWSLAAQGDRFELTPAILPAAVGCAATAYRRLQLTQPKGAEAIASASTGLLLGWTSLAATVNVAAGARILGADPTSPATIALSTIAAVGVAAVICATTLRSDRGFVPLAAATVWGLATTALTAARPPVVRSGAALGTIAVTAAAAIRASARRPRPRALWRTSHS